MNEDKPIEDLAEIIKLLRARGVPIDSPYDLENWFENHATHTNILKAHVLIKIGKS